MQQGENEEVNRLSHASRWFWKFQHYDQESSQQHEEDARRDESESQAVPLGLGAGQRESRAQCQEELRADLTAPEQDGHEARTVRTRNTIWVSQNEERVICGEFQRVEREQKVRDASNIQAFAKGEGGDIWCLVLGFDTQDVEHDACEEEK